MLQVINHISELKLATINIKLWYSYFLRKQKKYSSLFLTWILLSQFFKKYGGGGEFQLYIFLLTEIVLSLTAGFLVLKFYKSSLDVYILEMDFALSTMIHQEVGKLLNEFFFLSPHSYSWILVLFLINDNEKWYHILQLDHLIVLHRKLYIKWSLTKLHFMCL